MQHSWLGMASADQLDRSIHPSVHLFLLFIIFIKALSHDQRKNISIPYVELCIWDFSIHHKLVDCIWSDLYVYFKAIVRRTDKTVLMEVVSFLDKLASQNFNCGFLAFHWGLLANNMEAICIFHFFSSTPVLACSVPFDPSAAEHTSLGKDGERKTKKKTVANSHHSS